MSLRGYIRQRERRNKEKAERDNEVRMKKDEQGRDVGLHPSTNWKSVFQLQGGYSEFVAGLT